MVLAKNQEINETSPIDQLNQRKIEERGVSAEQLITIPLREEDLLRIFQLGSLLTNKVMSQLIEFLQWNTNIFAWSASDMPKNSKVITH